MTGPRLIAAAASLLLLAAGMGFAESYCFILALPLMAWSLAGVFLPAPRLDIVVSRKLSRIFARQGEIIDATLRFENQGKRLDFFELSDALPPGCELVSGSASWSGSLETGAALEIAYGFTARRGVFDFKEVKAVAEDPFSAVRSEASLDCPSRIAIFPETFLPPDLALVASSVRPFAGRSRMRRSGSGTDFSGMREYVPGDPLRSLNWRAEALWGQGIVNVFEEERALDVEIILDARSTVYGTPELFEAAVAASACLADALLDGGNRVGLLSYGATTEWTQGGMGREHQFKLRFAVARAELGDHAVFECLDNLPLRLFPPKSSILLVSPLLRNDCNALRGLCSLGYSLTVLRPMQRDANPTCREEVLAARLIRLEDEALKGSLRNAGIEVVDWDVANGLTDVMKERTTPR